MQKTLTPVRIRAERSLRAVIIRILFLFPLDLAGHLIQLLLLFNSLSIAVQSLFFSIGVRQLRNDIAGAMDMLVHALLVGGRQQVSADCEKNCNGEDDQQVLERGQRFNDHVPCDSEEQNLDQSTGRMHTQHLQELDGNRDRQTCFKKMVKGSAFCEDQRRLYHYGPPDHQADDDQKING